MAQASYTIGKDLAHEPCFSDHRPLPLSFRERPAPLEPVVNRFAQGLVIGGFAVVLLSMATALDWISLPGPSLPGLGKTNIDVQLPEEARIVDVEAINLDCRARIHAEIPVEGIRQREALGVTYRTDRITMTAVGDIDTCVDGSSATVEHKADGSTEVVIPGESIQFVRPRVDTVRTADSVQVDRDLVGRLSDAFPWVDDDLGLTPLAYAYAQNVIGSSQCMRAAYQVTEEILIDAYREQIIEQGADADSLVVRIDGAPAFIDPPAIDSGDVELRVSGDRVTCEATGDLGGVSRDSDL